MVLGNWVPKQNKHHAIHSKAFQEDWNLTVKHKEDNIEGLSLFGAMKDKESWGMVIDGFLGGSDGKEPAC